MKTKNDIIRCKKGESYVENKGAFLDVFQKAYFEYGKANGKFLFMNQLPRMLIETIIVCGLLLLIITKLLLGSQPAEIVPLLGVLALAAFRLMPSANRIVNLSNNIRFQMPLFNELYDDLLIIKSKIEQRLFYRIISKK